LVKRNKLFEIDEQMLYFKDDFAQNQQVLRMVALLSSLSATLTLFQTNLAIWFTIITILFIGIASAYLIFSFVKLTTSNQIPLVSIQSSGYFKYFGKRYFYLKLTTGRIRIFDTHSADQQSDLNEALQKV
jgi:hypothetical protein